MPSTIISRLVVAAIVTLFAVVLIATRIPAQSSQIKTQANQPSKSQWEGAAGGKMAFDVVPVKQDMADPSSQTVNSNIPLGPMDAFAPTGGLLSAANWPLSQYMIFAYKLTADQFKAVQSQLPKWANTARYDIEARASGNPTKDQFRLMMQALLADRFKLAIHTETRQLPAFGMVLVKPGKPGPHLQQHPEGAPCSTAFPSPPTPGAPAPPATVAGGFPAIRGSVVTQASAIGRVRLGGRNVPLAMFAVFIQDGARTVINAPQLTGISRPVLDKTGLTGNFDFSIEFTPQLNGSVPPGANFEPDESGPTFLEALKDQLGLKLEEQMGSVTVIVIDHVDQPSQN